MQALIFNGALERRPDATSDRISQFLNETLDRLGVSASIYNLSESGIPLFDVSLTHVPISVELMNLLFRQADLHLWLTPLYHGGMTGAMKNCLDWLEYSAHRSSPYLTGKRVGMVCWANSTQALQGIASMKSVAEFLKAEVIPFNVPIRKMDLFRAGGEISDYYQVRLEILCHELIEDVNKENKQRL